MVKRIVVVFGVFFILCGISFAESSGRIVVRTATTIDSVQGVVWCPTTTTKYSHSIYLPEQSDFNVMYKATSSGTVTAKLEMERSYTAPTTEYAADSAYIVTANDVLSSSITDQAWHMASPDTVQMPYIRFKCTGSGSNANTYLTIKVGSI